MNFNLTFQNFRECPDYMVKQRIIDCPYNQSLGEYNRQPSGNQPLQISGQVLESNSEENAFPYASYSSLRGYLGFTTIIFMHKITLITIVDDNWSATMFKAVEGLNNAVTAEDHTVKGRKGSREEGSSKNEARTIISSPTKRSDWMLAKSVRISFQKAVREGIATKQCQKCNQLHSKRS